jgi:hypothetical protein
VQNPTKKDVINKIYKPRLTLYKRCARGCGFSITLHIEFSVPKLLFGNNFDELEQMDFERVIEILYARLLKMGVVVSKANLRVASVYTVHYSKNIAFTDYTTVSFLLGYFQKIKVSRRFDLGRTDYSNEGELVRYHTKAFSLVFYDKIADLNKSKARAVEKNDCAYNLQPSLFEEARKKNPVEVLRMELRFNDRRKMRKVFALKLEELTFQRLFNKDVARKVLLSQWLLIYEELKPVLLQELNFLEHFELLARQGKRSKPQETLSMLGLSFLLKEHGYRPVLKNFKRFYAGRTLERLYKKIKNLNFAVFNRTAPFQKITNDLQAFQPLKMNQFTL